QQILVYQSSPICLTFVSKMTTNRQVKADSIFVDRQGLNEVLNRLVGIISKQKLQAILHRLFVRNRLSGTPRLTAEPSCKPPGPNGCGQEQPVKHYIHQSAWSF